MSHKENVVIHVPKVYDWVTRQVNVPLISFSGKDLYDPEFDKDSKKPFRSLCEKLVEPVDVTCHLATASGQKIDPTNTDALIIEELSQPRGRQDVDITLPSGETIVLQRVKVLVKGFVVVEAMDAEGTQVGSEPIPFATVQQFFLCAPEGTELDAHISFFDCDADLIITDQFQQLDISITLCLEVQMEAKVKLNVEAKIAKPREELAVSDVVCPERKFPPQCPEVFPTDIC
jgi:hypothetical protein